MHWNDLRFSGICYQDFPQMISGYGSIENLIASLRSQKAWYLWSMGKRFEKYCRQLTVDKFDWGQIKKKNSQQSIKDKKNDRLWWWIASLWLGQKPLQGFNLLLSFRTYLAGDICWLLGILIWLDFTLYYFFQNFKVIWCNRWNQMGRHWCLFHLPKKMLRESTWHLLDRWLLCWCECFSLWFLELWTNFFPRVFSLSLPLKVGVSCEGAFCNKTSRVISWMLVQIWWICLDFNPGQPKGIPK